MVIIIISGITIIVSISDDDFLVALIEEDNYNNMMFSFEYTSILAITSGVAGVIIQSVNSTWLILIFNILFFYTVGAVIGLISKIVTFGNRKAIFYATDSISEDISDRVITSEEELEEYRNTNTEDE